MARPSEGWRFRDRKSSDECWSIRFSHDGTQYSRGTGEVDKTRAAKEAERIYLSVVSGTEGKRRKQHSPEACRPLGEASSNWIAKQLASQVFGPDTAVTYADYFTRLFVPHFGSVEGINEDTIASLIQQRLARVVRATLDKELGCLRGFVASLSLPVAVATPPKKARGTPTTRKRVRRAVPLSPEDVASVIAALPEQDRRQRWVRPRYAVAYETSLRPHTLATLSVPENYRKGEAALRVSVDKTGFFRDVPLSAKARAELDAICPERGLIFGPARHEKMLKRYAIKLLGPRGDTFQPYDLRRSRITHLLERSGNIPGVQWLAGHKKLETTAKYVQPSMRAAESVLFDSR